MPPTLGAILGAGGKSDRGRRCWQTPHLEEIAAGHVAGRRIACDEARDFPVHRLAGAGIDEFARLEKEGNIPDVVQTERDERAFHDAIERERNGRLSMDGPIREGLDPVADWGPDKAQDHRRDNHGESRDDRHRPLAGEKAEIAGSWIL